MKKPLLLIIFSFSVSITIAQIKILFDATKAESAGNADWVIDADQNNLNYPSWNNGLPTTTGSGTESNAQRYPSPAVVLGQTYAENYWTGGLSYWGLDCVKRGYAVETLPVGASITYGNISNAQDLMNYKVFVVCEPNIPFTAAEKTAILNFVQNGGGLFMISDHDISDRNNDNWDSPQIWNDLMQNNSTGNTNPFGMIFNNSGNTAIDNFSETNTNYNRSLGASDSILHGPWGNVSTIKWSGGTSMTISPSANPTVRAVFYANAVNTPPSGNSLVMIAYGRYGNGKVVSMGDSSPHDDGSGDNNDVLYNGYMGDVPPNHRNLIMNATIWLATPTSTVPLHLISFTATKTISGNILKWQVKNEDHIEKYQVEQSPDGIHYLSTGLELRGINGGGDQSYQLTDRAVYKNNTINYYRLKIIDLDGSITYSSVEKIGGILKDEIRIDQNTTNKMLEITIGNLVEGSVNYQIISGVGQRIQQGVLVIQSNKSKLNVSKLTPGVYFLKLDDFVAGSAKRFIIL